MSQALAGIGVLVTRPQHQAEPLCRMIEAAGGRAWRFPVIAIAPPDDPAALDAVLAGLADFDLAIFISANAVEQGFAALARHGGWPPGLRVAAIGEATARALRERGIEPALRPRTRFDSEALLEHPELQHVAGQRVVIFRGVGGRELLAGVLRGRGAEVTYAEAYRRARPRLDPAPLLAAWPRREIQVAVVTSQEGLRNLWAMVGPAGQPWLRATPLVVASARVLKMAEELGFALRPRIAAEASDGGLFDALLAWRQAGAMPPPGRDQ
jgi:uroporphyrinogen-III synthase